MKLASQIIKHKRNLIFLSAIIFVAVVLLISFILKYKKPIEPSITKPPQERTMDEAIKDLTSPNKDGAKAVSVPDEAMKSLTAPANNTTVPLSNDGTVPENSVPVPNDALKNLTAPRKK